MTQNDRRVLSDDYTYNTRLQIRKSLDSLNAKRPNVFLIVSLPLRAASLGRSGTIFLCLCGSSDYRGRSGFRDRRGFRGWDLCGQVLCRHHFEETGCRYYPFRVSCNRCGFQFYKFFRPSYCHPVSYVRIQIHPSLHHMWSPH